MSDLISRQAVLDIIQKELNLRVSYDADMVLWAVKRYVSELPTAYNVDKVVDEVRTQFGCKDCEFADTFLHPACNECAELEVINDICDIVRKGGVENERE